VTEKEAYAILGEVGISWLSMPERSRQTLRELFTDKERQAADVLEGKDVPPDLPEPTFTVTVPAPEIRAEVPAELPRVPDLPAPDFPTLLASIPAPVRYEPPPLYFPPPDFGVLGYRPTLRRYRPPKPRRRHSPWLQGCLLGFAILLALRFAIELWLHSLFG
jgi:hypothetical protein